MGNYVLAADFGTSSLKLGLFNDRCRLTYLAPGKYSYRTSSKRTGWVEQNPNDWWLAFKKATNDTLKKYKVRNDEISCVSIGAHMGLVCLDEKGYPLRDAILFFDQRTVKQCNHIKEIIDEREVANICGNRISTVQTATQIIWLKQNEPDIYNKIRKFLITPGYISFLLTDEYSYDLTHASWSLLFDIKKRRWSEKMFQELDIQQDKFPDTKISCKLLGNITNKAAKETGIKAGTPVMVGGSDTPLAALSEKVINKGKSMITAGSVSSIITCTDKAEFSTVLLNRCHVVPDRWLIQGAMNAHSNVFEWLIRELYTPSKHQNISNKTNIFELVEREIRHSPPGSNGLIFLPYFAGERSPIWDPYARGVIFGLTFHNRREDIMRSAYEGITYAARHNLETIEDLDIKINELKIVGGGAKSEIWNQIKADVLGKRIVVEKAADASLIGSGMIACYGIGWIKDLFEFEHREYPQKVYTPRLRYKERYEKLFEVYKTLYNNLRSSFVTINVL